MANEILQWLYDLLWEQYRIRIPYAQTYMDLVVSKGGQVINDHIAFRTFNTNTGSQSSGIEAISRIFIPLGYAPKNEYSFPDKHLTAWHYEHPMSTMPKLFISQLEVAKLPEHIAMLINETVSSTMDPLSTRDKALLARVAQYGKLDNSADNKPFAERLQKCFKRPWGTPKRSTIERINKESQYAAWTLLHGNSVNHFTAFINKQNVAEWPNLYTTVEGLRQAGFPLREEIEGKPGFKLIQTSTPAIMEPCDVIEENGSLGKINWSYAYYELAERNKIIDKNGRETLFNGFLGDHATNLIEMTKTKN